MATRQRFPRSIPIAVLLLLLVILAGCGGDSDHDGSGGATATRTPTRTATLNPTATPTSQPVSAVSGLVVVGNEVADQGQTDLGAPPEGWGSRGDEASFEHALGNADWIIDGVARVGVTGPDGQFTIDELAPGRYTLRLTKTVDGNLIPIDVPFVVGDAAGNSVRAEVGQGLLRTAVSYQQEGHTIQEIRGPNATIAILEDGQVVELGDPRGYFTDLDRDGSFDPRACQDSVWACGENGACDDAHLCACLASCPFCDNCETPGVCVSTQRTTPYRCSEDNTCALPGDRCVCIPSCPDCTDCTRSACVPSCDPIDINGITIAVQPQLVVGRDVQAYATAQLSDGSVIDVTYLVEWSSSNENVAAIDSWGRIHALALGEVVLQGKLGDVVSTVSVRIVDRPGVRRILIQNESCYCRPFDAVNGGTDALPFAPPCYFGAPVADLLPHPTCGQVVRVGANLQLGAMAEFEDNTYENVTNQVLWQVSPAAVGSITAGRFEALSPGTAQVTATLGSTTSEPTSVKVVEQATLESLSIYPDNVAYIAVQGGPIAADGSSTCFDCGYSLTVLSGDKVGFHATGRYDTGEWRDVTDAATWSSSNTNVGTIDASGSFTAGGAGSVTVEASLEGKTSNRVDLRVVAEATLTSLSIYQESGDRVVAKSDQRFFRAVAGYDIGITRDTTAEAVWKTSDATIATFDSPGVLTARAAGTVRLWAETAGQRSNELSLEVFETSELSYCDSQNVNRAFWSDDFNRVVLESDCAAYTPPGLVTVRYTVTETRPHGGIFDPCLDLYVYRGNQRIRTIREEGCGEAFLPGNAPGAEDASLKYQLRAYWDMKDDNGNAVEPGEYEIFGRFYLYYDPVVKIGVTVRNPDGSVPTPRPTPMPTPTRVIDPMRQVSLRIGASSVDATGNAQIDAVLSASGLAVPALQVDLRLPPPLTFATQDNGKPSCKVNPAIDKPASGFAFQDATCANGEACSVVRAVILAIDNVDPIPDGAQVFSCAVAIGDAPRGSYPLGCSGLVASDRNGNVLPSMCHTGVIAVGNPETPQPSPGDIEGSCFVGSTSCEANRFFATAKQKCCDLAHTALLPGGISWCGGQDVAANGQGCAQCTSPCE